MVSMIFLEVMEFFFFGGIFVCFFFFVLNVVYFYYLVKVVVFGLVWYFIFNFFLGEFLGLGVVGCFGEKI